VTPIDLRSKIQPYLNITGTVSTETLRFIVSHGAERLATEDVEELMTIVDPEGKGVVHVDELVHKLIPVNT
jgi:Ca2+-binding EF-hand superfamily protein